MYPFLDVRVREKNAVYPFCNMLHRMNSVLHISKLICDVITKELAIDNIYVSLESENVQNQNKTNFNFLMK